MASLAEILAAKKAAAAQASETKPVEEKKEEPPSPPISVATIAEKAKEEQVKQALAGESKDANEELDPNVADIIPRIRALSDLADDDLTNAMADLKRALLENPDAVALMLDEDIGMMVSALRRMTGQALVEASAKTGKKATKKNMTAEELANAFDEL